MTERLPAKSLSNLVPRVKVSPADDDRESPPNEAEAVARGRGSPTAVNGEDSSADGAIRQTAETGSSSVFRRFTKTSYDLLLERTAEDRRLDEENKDKVDEGRLVDGKLVFETDVRAPHDPDLADGNALPQYFDEISKELMGTPLEDIDPNIRDMVGKTVASKLAAE